MTTPFRNIFNSEHSHFETCPIRNIVTSGHVISGQARFGTAQLHYFMLLCTATSHGKSVLRLKLQFCSNLLLFTLFMTVCVDSRPRVNERLVLQIKFIYLILLSSSLLYKSLFYWNGQNWFVHQLWEFICKGLRLSTSRRT